ncbi:hypothetical protein SO802_014526 [Lithocarpus litseifolius]|uniref:Uncharacterized protein n=1 Tax=Lithocarpus litseifolius TaxID=425828 RepID=A0AAW2CVA0_9ROSI
MKIKHQHITVGRKRRGFVEGRILLSHTGGGGGGGHGGRGQRAEAEAEAETLTSSPRRRTSSLLYSSSKRLMVNDGSDPNNYMYVGAFSACASLGYAIACKEIHGRIYRHEPVSSRKGLISHFREGEIKRNFKIFKGWVIAKLEDPAMSQYSILALEGNAATISTNPSGVLFKMYFL